MTALWRWLMAKWVLGWALAKNILRRITLGVRGPRAWLGRLAEESLGPVPEELWSYVSETSRCVGCSLCDLVGEADERPSRWIMAAARRPEDAPLARARAERLRALAPEIARICPSQVPAAEVARLIDDNARMLERP